MTYICNIVTFMRSFLQTGKLERVPQILSLIDRDRAYCFQLLHVSRERGRSLPKLRKYRQQHSHDVYHVVLFTGGKNRFMIRGRLEDAVPGVLALTGPSVPHNFTCVGTEPYEYLEMTFSLVGRDDDCRLPFKRILSLYTGEEVSLPEAPVCLTSRQRLTLSGRFALLLTQLSAKNGGWLAPFETVLSILLFLAGDVCAVKTPTLSSSPLDMAKDIIERRFRDQLTVADLAAAVHLSRAYFIRSFKSRFGSPPIAYLLSLRVRAAKNLLRNTNLLCRDIALRTGFEDEYYFSKMFKKITGLTPTAFRKR